LPSRAGLKQKRAMLSCPLCDEVKVNKEFERPIGNQFRYYKCQNCDLVFLDPAQRITGTSEKERYQEHQNNIRTRGYESFLLELLNPLMNFIDKSEVGLDFGSGPYPMLSEIAADHAVKLQNYDPFFNNDEHLLKTQYHFVTSCEVVEHFHYPSNAWAILSGLVKRQGYLAIKTSILYPETNFSNWYYKEDETHVAFYGPKTIDWITQKFHLTKVYMDKNVIIWQKI
jgi:hypothetical protein